MPENTVYVGRPTKWGNPFKLKGDTIYIDASYRRKILSRWVFYQVGDIDDVIRLYRLLWIFNHVDPDLQHWHDHFMSLDLMELKGKDLACFCPLSSPCHADFLIELVEAFCAEQNK